MSSSTSMGSFPGLVDDDEQIDDKQRADGISALKEAF